MNKRCVEAGVLTALALSSDLNQVSTFDRKHYFYSDLPVSINKVSGFVNLLNLSLLLYLWIVFQAGYQITQQRNPLARKGFLNFAVHRSGKELYERVSHIHQIQLEQDSGRSLHDDQRYNLKALLKMY